MWLCCTSMSLRDPESRCRVIWRLRNFPSFHGSAEVPRISTRWFVHVAVTMLFRTKSQQCYVFDRLLAYVWVSRTEILLSLYSYAYKHGVRTLTHMIIFAHSGYLFGISVSVGTLANGWDPSLDHGLQCLLQFAVTVTQRSSWRAWLWPTDRLSIARICAE